MGAQAFFVGLGAPSRPVRNDEVAVDVFRQVREQLVVPRETVDIGFHDAQVRHRRAEMRVHHGAEMAVEIVRGDVDFEVLGGGGDFHGLPHPVPRRVDDRDIDRLFAEIGQEFAQAQQRLAG